MMFKSHCVSVLIFVDFQQNCMICWASTVMFFDCFLVFDFFLLCLFFLYFDMDLSLGFVFDFVFLD